MEAVTAQGGEARAVVIRVERVAHPDAAGVRLVVVVGKAEAAGAEDWAAAAAMARAARVQAAAAAKGRQRWRCSRSRWRWRVPRC